jgi:hypothetical protein
MSQERYFIGPGLRDKLRETITRVDGMMDRERGVKSQVVHQEMMPGGGGGKSFRICTYTGAWSMGDTKSVKFKYQTTTPNTVAATNLFLSLPDNGERDCAIAKDGKDWHLVQWQWNAAAAINQASLSTGGLSFVSIPVAAIGTATSFGSFIPLTPQGVIVGATLGTASLNFDTRLVRVLGVSTGGSLSISITTCS